MLGCRHANSPGEWREPRDADAEAGRHQQLTAPSCGQKTELRITQTAQRREEKKRRRRKKRAA